MSPTPLLLGDMHHSGDHEGAWRLPDSPIDRLGDPSYYVEVARTLAGGGFDGIFFADFVGFDPLVKSVVRWPFEPTTLAAAVTAAVPGIGAVVPGSTVFATPEQLAATYRTLGAVSGGRAGWNIVTTGAPATARSFGDVAVPDHDERYRLAEGVVRDVLDRWGPDRPLLVQAGASEAGRQFAARFAQVVFIAAPTLEAARATRTDLRRRAAEFGRDPDELRVLPGILTIIGPTESAADDLRRRLNALVTEHAARHMLGMYGVELPQSGLDTPLREVVLDNDHQGIRSRAGVLDTIARGIGAAATWRDLVDRIAGSRGHLAVAGTGERIAEVMNHWLEAEACDGFVVKFAHSPAGMHDFVETVAPRLTGRGIGRGNGWPVREGTGAQSFPAT